MNQPFANQIPYPGPLPSMTVDTGIRQFSQSLGRFKQAAYETNNIGLNVAKKRAATEARYVNELAPAHYQALYAATPELRIAKDAMMQQLERSGSNRLGAALEERALSDLELDGSLSGEDVRASQQAARGAFASRGMLYGNQSAVAEVLGRQQFADQRRDTRRRFATDVHSQLGQQGERDRAFTSTAFGQLFDTLDPYKRIFGAYSQRGSQNDTMNQGMDLHRTNSSYQLSTNQMLLDDDFRRQESSMTYDLAQQQMKANAMSGMVGAAGQIGGALIGF
jgi:hypothetical protein